MLNVVGFHVFLESFSIANVGNSVGYYSMIVIPYKLCKRFFCNESSFSLFLAVDA